MLTRAQRARGARQAQLPQGNMDQGQAAPPAQPQGQAAPPAQPQAQVVPPAQPDVAVAPPPPPAPPRPPGAPCSTATSSAGCSWCTTSTGFCIGTRALSCRLTEVWILQGIYPLKDEWVFGCSLKTRLADQTKTQQLKWLRSKDSMNSIINQRLVEQTQEMNFKLEGSGGSAWDDTLRKQYLSSSDE